MNWSTFKLVSQTEIRLLLRRPGFWLYPALLVLMTLYLVSASSAYDNAFDSFVRIVNNIAFFQLPLMAWLVMPAVVRHTPPSRDWFWTTQGEAPLIILGQIAGLLLGLLLSLLLALVAATTLMLVQGTLPLAALAPFWGYALLFLLPITVFQLGTIFALGLIIRRTLPVIAVVTIFSALLLLGILLPYTTLFLPLNYTFFSLHIDPLAGIGAERPLVISLLWLYVSLALTLLALALWLNTRLERRTAWRSHHFWWVVPPLIIGMISSSAAGYAYYQSVQASIVPPPVVEQINSWSVATAEHLVTIEQTTLTANASLELINTSTQPLSSLVLALNPGLQVTQAQLDGQSVRVQPEGEAVRMYANQPIAPQQQVQLTLSYTGQPRLLREDYSHANGLSREEPTRFSRLVRSYLDNDVLLLQRDGDWRIWPLSSGPHLARQNRLQISFQATGTVVSSSEQVEQQDQRSVHTWSDQLPQLLISAAPYQRIESDAGVLYLAPMGNPLDYERATTLLRLRQSLAAWLGEPGAATPYQAIILPYTQDIMSGGSLVGMPASAAIPSSEVQENSYTDAEWAQRIWALRLVNDMLSERIAWETAPLNTTGQPLSVSTECTYDAAGNENCVQQIRGDNTPQAPQGRLVEPKLTSPLLHAWSVVMSRSILSNDFAPSALEEEQELWNTLQASAQANNPNQRSEEAQRLLDQRGLLPGSFKSDEATNLRIAELVMQIDQLHQELGDAGLRNLLQEMALAHPPGAAPLTETAFQHLVTTALAQTKGS